MKKIYVLAILLLVGTFVSAQINESFEGGTFPPTNWTKQSPDGGTGWTTTTVGTTPIPGFVGGVITACTNGGATMAYATYTTGGTATNNQWLITPQITGVTANYKLNFWMYKFGGYIDKVNVMVSTTTNAVASFTTTLKTVDYAVADSGWQNITCNLSAYAGQSIYIGFQEIVADNQTDGAFVAIDNVQVSATANISDISTKVYTSVFPTPAKDFLTIESSSKAKLVKIVNMVGQVVYEQQFDAKNVTVNTSNFKAGVYFLQVEYAEGTYSKKIVITE